MTRTAALLLFFSLILLSKGFTQGPPCVDQFIYSDVLFVIDNSGSITDAEYNDFESIILQTVANVRANCPTANVGVVHYGSDLGDSTVIEYDFSNTTPISNLNRQFCQSNPLGLCVGGDDLNSAIGDILTFFGNGDLTLTPSNRLSVVIFTDAYAGTTGPCSLVNCSAVRPYTNITTLKTTYNANVLVVGVEPDANSFQLAAYASVGGSYTGPMHADCATEADGCTTPRQYIPIQFSDDVLMAADSISQSVQCQAIIIPGIGVDAGADQTICDDGSTADLLAQPMGGTSPFTYEWSHSLGFGATKTVAPALTTTYSVTIVDANDCVDVDSVTVFVESCAPDCTADTIFTDILFMIDNSGSITDFEYNQFEAIMTASINKVQAKCPSSRVAVMHYGGFRGDEATVEYDFTKNTISGVNRQYCVSNPIGLCTSGDDLNAAMGNVITFIQNGDLNLNPVNDLSIVVFTDAYGGEVGPCDVDNCSAIRPYTNVGILKTNYGAKVLIVGVEPEADQNELAPYASIGGSYTGNMNVDCAGAVDGCTTPRLYIPIQFNGHVPTTSDTIANAVECTVTIIPVLSVEAGDDKTICGNLGGTATITAEASVGLPPYTYEWSHFLGFGPEKTVSPAVTTQYFVTVTDANLCTAIDSVTVKVIQCDDCLADAGTPLPHREICLTNGQAQLYTDENIGVVKPAGFEEVYILTDENLTIIDYRIGKGFFTVNKTGLYRIHTLIAEVNNIFSDDYLDLSIIKVGQSNLFVIINCIEQHDICADFDFPGRVNIVLGPEDMMCMDFENTINLCTDGIDNDNDGLIDCNDEDCMPLINCLENTLIACNDLYDNDLDGLVDCYDPDCFIFAKCFERDGQCNDGIDNDGDGLIDCADNSCFGSDACREDSPFTCVDGKDNDNDGLVDCEEADCRKFLVCAEFTIAACTDGIDNDFDGLVDCADGDCIKIYSQVCGLKENTTAFCTDGLDNDADGLIDCNDPDCGFVSLKNLEKNISQYISIAPSSCPDNDNGVIGIALPPSNISYQYSIDGGNTYQPNALFTNLEDGTYQIAIATSADCFISKEVIVPGEDCPEICGNGLDDDEDGLTDCDDPDCALVQLAEPRIGEATCPDFDNGTILIAYASSDGTTGDIEYSLNGGPYQTIGFFTGLNTGNYTIQVRNQFNCTVQLNLNVPGEETAQIDEIVTVSATCPKNDNGGIYIAVSPFSTSYDYSIDGGQTFQNNAEFNRVSPGTYDIAVLTSQGCILTGTAIVGGEVCIEICDNNQDDDGDGLIDCEDGDCDIVLPEVPIEVVDATCFEDGMIQFNQDGLGWTFSLNGQDFQAMPTFTDLLPGSYTAFVRNEHECQTTIQFEITTPVCIEICDNNQDDDGDGLIDCEDGDCGIVLPEEPIEVVDATCFEDGTVQFNQAGQDWTYSLDGQDFQTAPTFTDLLPGSYTAFVRNEHECQTTIQFEITTPVCIEICDNNQDDDGDGLIDCEDGDCGIVLPEDPIEVVDATCFEDGTVQFNQAGQGWTYSLDGQDFQSASTFTDLLPGSYTAFVRNEHGCQTTIKFEITTPVCIEICDNNQDDDGDGLIDCEDSECSLSLDSSFTLVVTNVTCPQKNNGSIEVNYSQDNLEYSLDNQVFQSQKLFENLVAGQYIVYVRNIHGCSTQIEAVIEDAVCVEICDNGLDDDGDGLVDCNDNDCGIDGVSGPVVTDATCPDNDNGRVEFTINNTEVTNIILYGENAGKANGGVDTSTGERVYYIENLLPGDYSVQVSTENCSITDSIVINADECDDSQGDIIIINVSALLQGPFNPETGLMNTTLNDNGYLPGQAPSTFFGTITPEGQPYNVAPWFYDGDEGTKDQKSKRRKSGNNEYDPDAVDWILVSLRKDLDKNSEVWRGAGIVHNDGTIALMKDVILDNEKDDYYIVLEHRNHLPVMSAFKVPVINNTMSYDFTKNDSYQTFIGIGQMKTEDGRYAMIAGNGELVIELSSDVDINSRDFNCWLFGNGNNSSYFLEDYDLNGDVNIKDRIIWEANNGIFTTISTK